MAIKRKRKSSNNLGWIIFIGIIGLFIWLYYPKKSENKQIVYTQEVVDSLNKIIKDCQGTSKTYNDRILYLQTTIDTLKSSLDSIRYKIYNVKKINNEKINSINIVMYYFGNN